MKTAMVCLAVLWAGASAADDLGARRDRVRTLHLACADRSAPDVPGYVRKLRTCETLRQEARILELSALDALSRTEPAEVRPATAFERLAAAEPPPSTQPAAGAPAGAGAPDAVDSLLTAKAAQTAAAEEGGHARENVPALPLGDSNWSLTVPLYAGLVRVHLGDTDRGEVDQFAALSGVGTGVKFRYSSVLADGELSEVFGFSTGLYFEPKVAVQGSEDSAQTLAASFVFSTFENFNLGVGYKFLSNEPGYDRFDGQNAFVLFGLGVDGATLLGKK